jgi:hypothetical protein
MSSEANILHETPNLYLYDAPGGLEIRLNGATHAVLVGSRTDRDVDKAKRTMERLERDIRQVRKAYQHW